MQQAEGDAVGTDGQSGVDEETEMLGVGELAEGLDAAGGGEVERGGILHEQERPVVGGDESEGVAAVGLVEVGGLDVGVVEEVVGGLCRGGGAGGGGDGQTGVFPAANDTSGAATVPPPTRTATTPAATARPSPTATPPSGSRS